jgi:hypothetical protein
VRLFVGGLVNLQQPSDLSPKVNPLVDSETLYCIQGLLYTRTGNSQSMRFQAIGWLNLTKVMLGLQQSFKTYRYFQHQSHFARSIKWR